MCTTSNFLLVSMVIIVAMVLVVMVIMVVMLVILVMAVVVSMLVMVVTTGHDRTGQDRRKLSFKLDFPGNLGLAA